MNSTQRINITSESLDQFLQDGYFVLPGVIPPEELEDLRLECDRLVALKDAELEKQGREGQGITHRNSRYFLGGYGMGSQILQRFLFGTQMAEICKATLGSNVYLFNEQFVVKAAERGMKFSWHQDSGYVGHPHEPYLSCWCALDPVCEENGTVSILPYSRAGNKRIAPHKREEETNDLVGYTGDDPGIPVEGPEGTIAVFSSVTFHRSSANLSPKPRRVYLTQYSAEPILNRDGSALWHWAEPFFVNGELVK